jgi:beta-lactamase regulating signal transducer with metallopeptidase domain
MTGLFTSALSALPPWLAAVVMTSLYATVVAGLVVGVQMAAGRRLPARWRFALWFLVLARLVPLPLPESRASLFNLLPASGVVAPRGDVLPVRAAEPVGMPAPEAPAGAVRPPEPPGEIALPVGPKPVAPQAVGTAPEIPYDLPTKRVVDWGYWVAVVYLAGAALLLGRQVLATLALRRIVRRAAAPSDEDLAGLLDAARRTLGVRRPVPLLVSDTLTSPALVGFWRPRLLLPAALAESLSAQDLRHIFLHECAHLRRHDVLLNYLVAALSVVHWFNPVVHLLMPRLRADRELATDELALQHAEPAAYGQTLLNVFQVGATACRAPASVAITETRSFFARRIHMIAGFRRQPKWVSVSAVLGLAVAGVCALTGPVSRAVESPPRGNDSFVALPEKEAGKSPVADSAAQGAAKQGRAFDGVYQTPAEGAVDRANAATRDKLEKPLQEFRMDRTPLHAVFDFLADRTGASFQVNWNALEEKGIDRSAPISARLVDVPARRALQSVLEAAGGAKARLAYTVEDGVVVVSHIEDLQSAAHRTTRVYNIRPLLEKSVNKEEGAASIVQLIKANVEPDSWRDAGGNVGTIKDFNGLLTINTSSNIHHQISELLGTMAQANAAPDAAGVATAGSSAGTGAFHGSLTINGKPVPLDGATTSPGVQLAGVAMDHVAGLLGTMVQQLGALTETQMKLQQERAAMMAKSGQSNSADLKALDAQLATVNRQLAETQQKLAKAQADAGRRTSGTPEMAVTPAGDNVERFRHMYDVRALVGAGGVAGNLTADQRAAVDDLVRTFAKFVDPSDTVSSFNGTIIVVAPADTVIRLQELMSDLERTQRERDKAK